MRNRTLDRLSIATLVIACGMAAVTSSPLPSDARPPRPPTARGHYTFDPAHLAKRVDPYRGRFDRVILLNTIETRVTAGKPMCRLGWKGQRVDLLLDTELKSGTVEIELPRGALVEDVDVRLIGPGGDDARKIRDPAVETVSDTLRVHVPDLGDARVVEVTYELEGTGISVDESFLFQPLWPVLSEQYRFSVSRELWQEAANQGLDWEFQAVTEPETWQPQRDDSPEFFSWYWRLTNVEPIAEDATERARSVTVSGYLPVPALAAFDPAQLPDVTSLQDVIAFQERLSREFDTDQGEGSSGPAPSRATSGGTVGSRDRELITGGGRK